MCHAEFRFLDVSLEAMVLQYLQYFLYVEVMLRFRI